MSILVTQIPSESIPKVWPLASKYIEAGLEDHPWMRADDVFLLLCSNMATLFLIAGESEVLGAVVMEVIQYPRHRVANEFVAGGERGRLAEHFEEVHAVLARWATDMGCTGMGALGRPGWEKWGRGFGYQSKPARVYWRLLDVGRRRAIGN